LLLNNCYVNDVGSFQISAPKRIPNLFIMLLEFRSPEDRDIFKQGYVYDGVSVSHEQLKEHNQLLRHKLYLCQDHDAAQSFLANCSELITRRMMKADLYANSKSYFYDYASMMQFSNGFQDQLYSALNKLRGVTRKGWGNGPVDVAGRLEHCQDLGQNFLKNYNKHKKLDAPHIHVTPVFNAYDRDQRFITHASYTNSEPLKHDVQLYFYVEPCLREEDNTKFKYTENHKKIESHFISRITGKQKLPLVEKNGYSYKVACYDRDSGANGYIGMPALCESDYAVACIAHELTHYALTKCAVLFENSPQQSEKHFGFTSDDYHLYRVGRLFYTNLSSLVQSETDDECYKQGLKEYKNHPEEILANKFESRLMTAQKYANLYL
jgi:hypothetical protein